MSFNPSIIFFFANNLKINLRLIIRSKKKKFLIILKYSNEKTPLFLIYLYKFYNYFNKSK